ncbi:MAG: phenylalanine--tRNA ligase subunit beta, partial [Bdellovibrionales bacterium]|nr:phenylalanine--tRNA ligase subunit beta [Bdellovibrionales bacterium]
NGLEIKAAKIRGVASEGMLCSLDELCFDKSWQAEEGIYQLAKDAPVGLPLAGYLGLDDWILEIGVTPNRGDALSHIGVARDVAALFGLTLKWPEVKPLEGDARPVVIENAAGVGLCPQYFGRLIEGVKVGPSPDWLKKRLEAVGVRSHNNLVDVTNFVLFEMGQPLHAFDAGKLKDGDGSIRISVRQARDGEKFQALNDKTLDLKNSDLLIAAGKDARGVALAGVMGGKDTEVSEKTVNVLLEAAEFQPSSVRRTSRRLGLLSDAAFRYERGIDSSRVEWAMNRATQIILDVAGGKARKAVCHSATKEKRPPLALRLRLAEIQRVLGKCPEISEVVRLLRSIGIHAEPAAGESGVVQAEVPAWRKDIRRSIDLVEEVIRLWGFDRLEGKLPLAGIGAEEPKLSQRVSYFFVRRLRRHLASLGFFEAVNYGFTSKEAVTKLMGEGHSLVEIQNPVSLDYAVMKPSLLTGLLPNVFHNFAHRRRNLRLFEVRRVFENHAGPLYGGDERLETGVRERTQLSLVLTGDEVDEFWQGKAVPVDFYSMKGAVESLFELLGVGGIQFRAGAARPYLHPGQSAEIVQGNRVYGVVGRLHPRVEKSFELDQDVFVAELDVEAVLPKEQTVVRFRAFSHFPQVERDFSVLVRNDVTSAQLRAAVSKVPLLRELRFFDVYRGSRVPDGFVSYAFRVVLGSDDHTLTDEEIKKVQDAIFQGLQKEFSAQFAGLR